MSRKYAERLAASAGVNSSKAFESDFGLRILKKYGWKEGQGLGANDNGRTDCIQSVRREQKVGLGGEKRKTDDNWDNWWSDCFNNIAKKVTVTAAAKDDSDSDSSSDDEAKAPEGGKTMFACKQAGAMQGKMRRVMRQDGAKA